MEQSIPVRRTADRSAASARSGFTMIELMIVVAVLSVILLLGAPRLFDILERRTLEGNAEQVSVYLRKARYLAIQSGDPLTVTVDGAREIVFIDADADGAFDPTDPQEAHLGVVRLPRGVTLGGPAGDNAKVDGFPVSGNLASIVFAPDGSAATVGGIRLRDREGDDFLEVRLVEPATARLALRKWNGTTWIEKGVESWQWN